MFDIMPIKKANHDCFQACLATLAKYWNREYFFMFADSWGFKYRYEEPDTSFGNRIDTDHARNIAHLLTTYHGIGCDWKFDIGLDEAFSMFRKELDRKYPVLLVVDSFWCPWLKDYQKTSLQHFCIILEIEEDTKNVICLDPYYSTTPKCLSYENLKQGYVRFLTFELLEPVDASTVDVKFVVSHYVLKCLDSSDGYTAFEHMGLFAEAIRESFDVRKEMDGFDDIESVLMFFRLKLLENGRGNMAIFLEYLSKNYHLEELDVYSNQMREFAKGWDKLRLFIMKQSFAKSTLNTNEKISWKIYKMIESEKKVALALKDWVDQVVL